MKIAGLGHNLFTGEAVDFEEVNFSLDARNFVFNLVFPGVQRLEDFLELLHR